MPKSSFYGRTPLERHRVSTMKKHKIRRGDSFSSSSSFSKDKEITNGNSNGWNQALRVVCWIVSVNVWAVLLFTKRHFHSMARVLSNNKLDKVPRMLPVGLHGSITVTREMRQQFAREALADAEQWHVFDTPVTTHASVMEHAYVRNWDACTLEQAQDRRDAAAQVTGPLTVVVVGGAETALPPRSCDESDYAANDGGRYSTLLGLELNQFSSSTRLNSQTTMVGPEAAPFFEIINMGHAAMFPSVQGMLLDHLMDPYTTDLIIWEHALFDFKRPLKQHDTEMDFCLSRLEAHFSAANRSPPPILLLHLWDELLAWKHPHFKPIRNMMDSIIDKYREQKGWNIQVINVGAAVVPQAQKNARGLLVDQHYHSTCRGSQFIADVIAHAFYNDLAQCKHTILVGPLDDSKIQRVSSATYMRNSTVPLSELLFRKDVLVRSLNHWKPNLGISTSHLNIPNLAEAASLVESIPMRSATTSTSATTRRRSQVQVATHNVDERQSYRLPLCAKYSANYDYLNLTIAEPTLEWLGIAYSGGRVEASINGNPLPLIHDGKGMSGGLEGIRDWVHVGHLVPPAPTFNVSFCSRKIDKEGQSSVWLHQLVGLLLSSPQSWS